MLRESTTCGGTMGLADRFSTKDEPKPTTWPNFTTFSRTLRKTHTSAQIKGAEPQVRFGQPCGQILGRSTMIHRESGGFSSSSAMHRRLPPQAPWPEEQSWLKRKRFSALPRKSCRLNRVVTNSNSFQRAPPAPLRRREVGPVWSRDTSPNQGSDVSPLVAR